MLRATVLLVYDAWKREIRLLSDDDDDGMEKKA